MRGNNGPNLGSDSNTLAASAPNVMMTGMKGLERSGRPAAESQPRNARDVSSVNGATGESAERRGFQLSGRLESGAE